MWADKPCSGLYIHSSVVWKLEAESDFGGGSVRCFKEADDLGSSSCVTFTIPRLLLVLSTPDDFSGRRCVEVERCLSPPFTFPGKGEAQSKEC